MANEAERGRLIQVTKERLNKWREITPEKLVRAEELGIRSSFEPLRPFWEDLLSVVARLLVAKLERVPIDNLQTLAQAVGNFDGNIQQILQYDPTNPQQNRLGLIGSFQSALSSLWTAASPILVFHEAQDQSINKAIAEQLDHVETQARAVDSALKTVNEAQTRITQVEQALETARSKIGKASIADFSDRFANHAKKRGREAWAWLALALLLGLGLAVGILKILELYPLAKDAPPGTIAEYVIARIGPVAILFFFITWCSRNYRNARHLAEVNDHRSNALNTFKVFVETTSDEATRNAVLLEATRCIFGPVATGFGGGDDESNPLRMIEILKTVGTGGGRHD